MDRQWVSSCWYCWPFSVISCALQLFWQQSGLQRTLPTSCTSLHFQHMFRDVDTGYCVEAASYESLCYNLRIYSSCVQSMSEPIHGQFSVPIWTTSSLLLHAVPPLCRKSISVNNQPPRSSQPGHPSVGRCNEYQPNGIDALWLGVKAGMVRVWVAGKTKTLAITGHIWVL